MEAKLRKDMNPDFQWDLTPIFESDNAWQAAYAKAEAAVKGLEKLPGTLAFSDESMKTGLDGIFAAQEAVERVYSYAFLAKSGDNGDPKYQEMEARAINLFVALETATAFVSPEILSIPAEMLEDWMAGEGLATYRHMLGDIVRGRAHTLDAKGERMLAMLGDVAQTPGTTFDMFESVDMRFPNVHDETGAEVPLTHGSFTVYRESRDAKVRKEAFETYFKGFENYINTLASVYGGAVKLNCFQSDVRSFGNACEAALFGNNVPVSLYDGLIEAVHGALPAMREYLALRQRALGLKELHLYDLYTPIVDEVAFDMPYAEAQKLVKAALAPLGEEYAALLDRSFSEKWIDVYENQGKSTGALKYSP